MATPRYDLVHLSLQCLPRDAMHKRGLLSCGVRLSVTFVHSLEMSKHIRKHFSPTCVADQIVSVFIADGLR